jgi:hypothetical protein
MKRLILAGPLVLALAFAAPLNAQSESQNFGGPNFEYQKTGYPSCGDPCYIWYQNDFWAQTFLSSSLGSVNRLTLNLNVANVLSGPSMVFHALLNGTNVGSFGFSPSSPDGLYSFDYFFSPVFSASDYRVELRVASATIPGGLGSVGLRLDGSSSVTIHEGSVVPEPSTWILMLTGLLGLGFAHRMRKRTVA